MAATWKANSSAVVGTGTVVDMPRPAGVSVGDLLIVILGFEGVAAGSGPWVVPGDGSDSHVAGNPTGWKQICYQAPSATGCGLEVWAAIHNSGTDAKFNLVSSLSYAACTVSYSGEYLGDGTIFAGAIRGAATAQVVGDDPAAPSIYGFANETIVAIGADLLHTPGWGTPTPAGWQNRLDTARSGYGTVEITAADHQMTAEGDSGSIPWSALAAAPGDAGATATLSIRPTPPTATSPLIAVEFAVSN